jgi:hypothetical protein
MHTCQKSAKKTKGMNATPGEDKYLLEDKNTKREMSEIKIKNGGGEAEGGGK